MDVRYRIGTSGWHCDHWRGGVYPLDLPKNEWLKYYAAQFDNDEAGYAVADALELKALLG